MINDIMSGIRTIISEYTGIDISTINPDADFREQTNLDSMQIVTIIARIEEKFGIDMPMSVMGVNTLNEFMEVVKKAVEEQK